MAKNKVIELVHKIEYKTRTPGHEGSLGKVSKNDRDYQELIKLTTGHVITPQTVDPRFSAKQVAVVRALAAKGLTVQEIAYQTKLSVKAVLKLVQVAKIKVYETYMIMAIPAEGYDLPKLYFKNVKSVADYFHRSLPLVGHWLREGYLIHHYGLVRGKWSEKQVGKWR